MEHRVRLSGAPEAAPELACLRVLSQLPPNWSGEIRECGTGYAILALRTDASAEDVAARVDEVIAELPLRGWKRS
ncbi:hypothetical protein [Streptomyces subrutilus]|uniref:Uncharacterized protein n=1 Tax=Streptomyces subrutilus TaxID=36818 RepID=A0A5P2UR26_9ACTN|nr:hypothetical protein [Streptomyces subrutilus]QEU79167.1 hypothetical protein CP968_13365 [Streptomyces subrutilus]WSJ31644.1 hypothetical protein OG479_21460 [Streptomyces subrutilus]GGZ52380.1 hypothetical protein GCM10010371_09790 [Streptomyces subrutilus]